MKFSELKNKFKSKYVIRIAAGVLTVAILGTSYGAYQVNAAKATTTEVTEESTEKTSTDDEVSNAISSIISDAKSDAEVGKEETVYLIADADGTVNDTIVSDWLKNSEGAETIEDASDLSDIENVKGDETFTQDGDKLTWQAGGNDIFYQGSTTKEAPISEKVTYMLDGTEIAPEDLAGKSGKVTIRFDYTNNEKTTAEVGGEDTDIYVPFTVLTGMMLDDTFTNVEVTNGKVISDGKNNIVVGVAMPGLQESLDVDEKDFDEDVEFPNYVEVTADVKDFSLEMTMSVAMNGLLSSTSMDNMDLTELDDAINTLTDSSDQLVEGSDKLSDGTTQLLTAINTYTAGTQTLADGINTLAGSTPALVSGAQQLSSGMSTAKAGADTLNASAASIRDGVATLDAALNTAMTDAEKAEIIATVDQTVASQFAGGKADEIRGLANTQITGNAQLQAVLSAGAKSVVVATAVGQLQATPYPANPAVTTYQALQMSLGGSPSDEDIVNAYFATQGSTLDAQVAAQVATINSTLVESVVSSAQTVATQSAETTAASVADMTKKTIAAKIEATQANGYSLVTGSAALADGAATLTSGLNQLNNGASQLYTGTTQLQSGVGQLQSGVNTLVSNNSKLTDATKQLSDGANTLADGMAQFDEEGIAKIADAYNGDVKTLLDRFDAIVKAGSDYNTFTEIADGVNGDVKFIIRTDSVKADDAE